VKVLREGSEEPEPAPRHEDSKESKEEKAKSPQKGARLRRRPPIYTVPDDAPHPYAAQEGFYETKRRATVSAPAPAYCESPLVRAFSLALVETVREQLQMGLRVLYDVEPLLYESALSALKIAARCWIKHGSDVTVAGLDGSTYNILLQYGSRTAPVRAAQGARFIVQIMPPPSSEPGQAEAFLDSVILSETKFFLIVSEGQPEKMISVSSYRQGLVNELTRKAIRATAKFLGDDSILGLERYVGRVPYDVILTAPADLIAGVAKKWRPPPPPYSNVLVKSVRDIEDLVAPGELVRTIHDYIMVAEIERRGSLLLVGLPTSGRKTIATAIAGRLNLPVYKTSVTNFLSRWVGESETKMRAFFAGMRARGGVAVFDGLDLLFKKTQAESGVIENLRTILFDELSRDDNNYLLIFTADAKEGMDDILSSPLLGELKLVVPLPVEEERRVLAKRFFHEIAGADIDRLARIVGRRQRVADPKEFLDNYFATIYAEASTGLTVGELYRVMKFTLRPILVQSMKRGELMAPDEIISQIKLRDYSMRMGKVNILIEIAKKLGRIEIARALVRVKKELEKVGAETRGKLSELGLD